MSKTTDKIKSNILFFGISLFFLTIAITYFTVKQLTRTKLDKKISSSKLITFLVNGTSEKDELSFSVLILLYPAQKRCGLYFINPVSSFSDGDSILEAGGSQESFLSKKLSAISGYNINYYINIKEANFTRIIDILGGIPVYLDNNSVISSEKFSRKYGENSMSGEEVADYLKIADKNTPKEYVERLGRQESVLLTFYDNLPSVKQAIRKEWLSFLFGLIETNLAAEELYTLYDYVTSNHFIFSISELPGEPAEHPKSKKKFLQIKEDTAKTAFSRFEKNITSDYFLDGETARVEVLNGTDVTGLAKRVKSILNDKRFKVLSTDNGWLNNQKNTIVIDRSGNAEYSYRIAEALGSKKIRHNIKKESGLDATVLVGEDFEINP